MARVSKILYLVDPSNGEGSAGARAAALAQVHGADLRRHQIASRGAEGRRHADDVAALAQRIDADLIVIGASYGRRWGATVAGGLGRSAPCPVMVVPEGAASLATTGLFAEIVCAIDFTEASVAALGAGPFVLGGRGRLSLVRVLEDVPGRMVYSGGEALRSVRDFEARVAGETRRLRELAPGGLHGWQVEPVVVSGVSHRGILRVAADVGADLIVIGTECRTILGEMLAGSTARGVLGEARCPVLLVPRRAAAERCDHAGHRTTFEDGAALGPMGPGR
jgi:nucleotide-binding universal stress UspA family protein